MALRDTAVLQLIIEAKDRATRVLRDVRGEVDKTNRSTAGLSGSTRDLADVSPKLKAQMDALHRSMDSYETKVKSTREEQDRAAQSTGFFASSAVKAQVAFLAVVVVLAATVLAIKNLVSGLKEAARFFIENANEAEGLRAKLGTLSTSWQTLKLAIGSVVVESISLEERTEDLTRLIDDLSRTINANREEVIRWGRSMVEGFVLVANAGKQAADVIRLAFQAMADGLNAALATLRIAGAETHNFAVRQLRDSPLFAPQRALGRALGRGIPGELDTTGDRRAREEALNRLSGFTGAVSGNLDDFNRAVANAVERINAPIGAIPTMREEEEAARRAAREARDRAITDSRFPARGSPRRFGVDRFGPVGGQGLDVDLDRVEIPDLPGALPVSGFANSIQTAVMAANEGIQTLDQSLGAFVGGTLANFGSTWQNIVASVASGSKTMGEAFGSAMANGIAAAASIAGQYFMALGFAALGMSLVPPPIGTPTGAAAAAKFFAAAALLHTIGGLAQGMAGGGRGGGGFAGGARGIGDTSLGTARDRGDATIVIEGGLLDMSNPRQAESLREALEKLSGRRVTIEEGRRR